MDAPQKQATPTDILRSIEAGLTEVAASAKLLRQYEQYRAFSLIESDALRLAADFRYLRNEAAGL